MNGRNKIMKNLLQLILGLFLFASPAHLEAESREQETVDAIQKNYEAVVGRPLRLQGLGLPAELSQRILHGNFEGFKAKEAAGSKILREIDWTRMGIQPTDRKAGELAPGPEESDWVVLKREALEGAAPMIRSKAIQGLARKQDERRALEILAEVLRREPVPEVREEALSAIEFFEPVPQQPVLDRLVADPVPAIRLRAIEIIEDEEWQGDEIEKMLIAATADADAEVRLSAVSVLGELEAWTVLGQIAREHQDPAVRSLAAEQLKDR